MKTVHLLFSAVNDLFVRHATQRKKLNGYAFLVHPRDISDVYRKYSFLRILPVSVTEYLLTFFWPVVLSEIKGIKNEKTGEYISGFVITIPLTAKKMMRDRELAKRFIIKASILAEKKGAKITGLGALTASLSHGGLDLLPHVKSGITTGRIYTSKVIVDTAISIIEKLGLKKDEVQVAIVGAAGSIGTACAQLLSMKNFSNLLLVDLSHNNKQVSKLIKNVKHINKDIKISRSNNIESIKNSDIIIAVTNKPEALITSKNLKSGSVVIDDAQPSDIDSDVVLNRRDVLVLDGGLTRIDNINLNFNFGLKNKEDIFSCLAETMILSAMGHEGNFQVGKIMKIDNDLFDKIEKQSEKMGFTVSNFQNFDKTYSEDDINYVKSIIKKRV